MKKTKVKLKELLSELDIKNDERIFLHQYGKSGDETSKFVSELNEKELNKEVVLARPGYGGKRYDYSCYLFVLK